MILEFSVTNFRSFKETQTLSMIADSGKKEEQQDSVAVINDKLKVLKSAVIYGANASGKSNLLMALVGLKDTILHSVHSSPGKKFHYYQPFLFDDISVTKTTDFELYFLVGNIRYKYNLSILKDKVEQESLYYYPRGREAKLFDRNKNKYTYGESLKGKKTTVESLTADNQLYLSKGAANNMELLKKVFLYFVNNISSGIPLDRESEEHFFNLIHHSLYNGSFNEVFINNMKHFVRSFNTGITDFRIAKISENYHIWTKHEIFEDRKLIGERELRLEDESEGTQRLFYMSVVITNTLMNGGVIIIDEFERSLHPHIANFIIQMFSSQYANKKKSQIIVATHDTSIIDEENELRRDQVWFIEKDRSGGSELYSLSDFEGIRRDIPFDKWYLSGRFGAVSNVRNLEVEFNFEHDSEKAKVEA